MMTTTKKKSSALERHLWICGTCRIEATIDSNPTDRPLYQLMRQNKLASSFDRYCTPRWMVEQLIRYCSIDFSRGVILECCAGQGDIAEVLAEHCDPATADIDPNVCPDYNANMASTEGWDYLGFRPDWVITNPPYNEADRIVPLAFDRALVGVAMLLRCTWLESTLTGMKAQWLADHPPSQIISLPRFAFAKSPKPGKWGTDSVPTCWVVWRKDGMLDIPFVTVPHSAIERHDPHVCKEQA